jgi:hypothetical protein
MSGSAGSARSHRTWLDPEISASCPASAYSHDGWVDIAIAESDPQQAITLFERSLVLDPADTCARDALARLGKRDGHWSFSAPAPKTSRQRLVCPQRNAHIRTSPNLARVRKPTEGREPLLIKRPRNPRA